MKLAGYFIINKTNNKIEKFIITFQSKQFYSFENIRISSCVQLYNEYIYIRGTNNIYSSMSDKPSMCYKKYIDILTTNINKMYISDVTDAVENDYSKNILDSYDDSIYSKIHFVI